MISRELNVGGARGGWRGRGLSENEIEEIKRELDAKSWGRGSN